LNDADLIATELSLNARMMFKVEGRKLLSHSSKDFEWGIQAPKWTEEKKQQVDLILANKLKEHMESAVENKPKNDKEKKNYQENLREAVEAEVEQKYSY
jgi:putative protein kinase ArgK-like GTPase of G3E family